MKGLIPVNTVAAIIFQIRGYKVMLDRDLTELNSVQTRTLKQAVSRNIQRFPEDFMFILAKQ